MCGILVKGHSSTEATYQLGDPCPGTIDSGTCTTCGGDGLVDQRVNCSHGRSSSHSYCSHKKVGQHDN